MSSFAFRDVLVSLSQSVVDVFANDDPEILSPLELLAVTDGTILFDPATPAQIAAAEARMGRALPDDYKSFLGVSNGMILPSLENHTVRLLPVQEIGIFSDIGSAAMAELIEIRGSREDDPQTAIEDFLAPISLMPHDVTVFRHAYPNTGEPLQRAIAVSEIVNTAAVLLCPFSGYDPQVFETWEVGPWTGCIRYKSFQHFVKMHLEAFLKDAS